MLIIGIDPGLSGGIAALNGKAVRTWDIPTHSVTVGGKPRKRLDDLGLLRLARMLASLDPEGVAIENVGGLPRQSASGAFTFGDLTGALRMAFLSCGVAVHRPDANTWKAHFRLKGGAANKDASRAKASLLFPSYADQWARATDEGKAEAVLIAKYTSDVLLCA